MIGCGIHTDTVHVMLSDQVTAVRALYTSGENNVSLVSPPMTIISPVGSVAVQVEATPTGISPAGSHDWVRGEKRCRED